MSVHLGDFPTSATVHLKWDTNAVAGESITRATNGSIRIYKGNSTTQRSSSNGITDSEDHDALTGVHHCTIDLSDNTDAGFYAAGNEYQVVLAAATIDGKVINATLASFSIERSGGTLALVKIANVFPSGAVVTDAGNTAFTFKTDRTETATDYWKDAYLVVTSGTLIGQVHRITAYNGTTKFITVVNGFTAAPAAAVTFLIINK